MNKQGFFQHNSKVPQNQHSLLTNHPNYSTPQTLGAGPNTQVSFRQQALQEPAQKGLQKSESSVFQSEEGDKHLGDSSFSSLNEETPTLIPKWGQRQCDIKQPSDFTLLVQNVKDTDLNMSTHKTLNSPQKADQRQNQNYSSQIPKVPGLRPSNHPISSSQNLNIKIMSDYSTFISSKTNNTKKCPDIGSFSSYNKSQVPPGPGQGKIRSIDSNQTKLSGAKKENMASSLTRCQQPIVLDSMNLIQRNRVQLMNRSTSQSVKEMTTIGSQDGSMSGYTFRKQVDNRVSEQPSESCSVLDEGENFNGQLREISSCQLSDDSQSSDKENSNISSNQSKSTQRQPTQLTKNKIRIPAPSTRNIRMAPQFKGMSSVMNTSAANKRTVSPQKYCLTQPSNDRTPQAMAQSRVAIALSNQKPKQKAPKPTVKENPIVFQNKEHSNVYHIIGKSKNKIAGIQNFVTPQNNTIDQVRPHTTSNARVDQNLQKVNQQCHPNFQLLRTPSQPATNLPTGQFKEVHHKSYKGKTIPLHSQQQNYAQHICQTENAQSSHQTKFANQVSKKYLRQPIYAIHPAERFSTESNTHLNESPVTNAFVYPQVSPIEEPRIASRCQGKQFLTGSQTKPRHLNQYSGKQLNQVGLAVEDSGKRINTDPSSYSRKYQRYMVDAQHMQNLGLPQQRLQNKGHSGYINTSSNYNPSVIPMHPPRKHAQADSQLTGNEVIDFDDLNDGIVYVEGGIGLAKKQKTPQSSQEQPRRVNPSRDMIQKAVQFNQHYLAPESTTVTSNQGYIDMAKKHKQDSIRIYNNHCHQTYQNKVANLSQHRNYSNQNIGHATPNRVNYSPGYCRTEPTPIPMKEHKAPQRTAQYQLTPAQQHKEETLVQALRFQQNGFSGKFETEGEPKSEDNSPICLSQGQKVCLTDGGPSSKNQKKQVCERLERNAKKVYSPKESKCIIM